MELMLIVLCPVAALCAVVSFVISKQQQDKEHLRVERLRRGEFYRKMHDSVRQARRRPLDQVLIERDLVIFRGMKPPEVISRFSTTEHGLRYMSPQRLKTLVTLLGEDIPELSDPRRYRLKSYKVMRPNGEWDKAWEYTARPQYKSYALRSDLWRVADSSKEQ